MRRIVSIAVLIVLAASAVRAAPDDFDPRDQRRLFAVRDTNAARHAIDEARAALEARPDPARPHRGPARARRDDRRLLPAGEESSRASVLWSSAAGGRARAAGGPRRAEQREAYEQLAAPSAAPLLDDSLQRRDETGLREVLRRYGASRAGVRAAGVLADDRRRSRTLARRRRYLREGLRYAPQESGCGLRLFDALAAGGDRSTLADPAAARPGLEARAGPSASS